MTPEIVPMTLVPVEALRKAAWNGNCGPDGDVCCIGCEELATRFNDAQEWVGDHARDCWVADALRAAGVTP